MSSPFDAPPALPILAQAAQVHAPRYLCPGETQPVSRAVHLARLAAYYPPCRTCSHVADVGAIPRPQPDNHIIANDNPTPSSCLTRDGFRGIHHNELSRTQAARIAEGIAAVLWDGLIRRGRSLDDETAPVSTNAAAPVVVTGLDSRPASPDIAAGVVPALRRSGCHVIDVGRVSAPALAFAVHHLRASAGIYLTGAGASEACVGLDLIGADGVPWSAPGRLVQVAVARGAPRPTRIGGTFSTFDVGQPLHADFPRRLQGLAPTRVGIAFDCSAQRRSLTAAFGALSDHLIELPLLSQAARRPHLSREQRRHLRTRLHELDLRMAIHIAEDGKQLRLWDEQAQPLAPGAWLVRLAEQQLAGASARAVVVSTEVSALTRGRLQALGAGVIVAGPDRESLVGRLLESRALLAADGAGRLWFQEHVPVCDGLVTTAALLKLASESDEPISHWAT